jgi:hypothetical protein
MFIICVLVLVVSCKFGGGGSEYSSTTDKFSIAFPSGGGEVETKTDSVKYAKAARTYSKSFDNRSDNFRSYEVQVLDVYDFSTEGKTQRQILEIALNGWEKEPETKIKEITVNGKNGIDSLRYVSIGSVGMAFREVVFWSEADKKLYLLRVAAVKKENTQTSEAEKFINSFKLKA